jgi:hypothetical protein
MWGQDWRPEFSPEETRRELQIIRDDLHCNAVRICGQDPGRLIAAGRHALDLGLEVWLSPELWDHSPGQTLDYIATAARAAQDLHRHQPGQMVFSVGSGATLFMAGIVEGGSVFERLEHHSRSTAGRPHGAGPESAAAKTIKKERDDGPASGIPHGEWHKMPEACTWAAPGRDFGETATITIANSAR